MMPVRVRTWVAILMFIGCFYLSMLRINYSVILLLCLNPVPYNIINDCPIKKLPELKSLNEPVSFLTPLEVSSIFAVYNLGATLTLIFAEKLQKRFGCTLYIGVAMLCSAVLTLLTPTAIVFKNFYLLVFVRFLIGALLSPIYPMMNKLMTIWSPTNKRNTYGVIIFGSSVGTFTTVLVYGHVILQLKHTTTYLTGMIVVIWCMVWLLYVKDNPAMHEYITPEELEESANASEETTRRKIPWREILHSSKIRALALLLWCNTWNVMFFMDYLPIYYNQMTSKSFTENMDWVSLALFARFLSTVVCLPIINYFLITNVLSITLVRKLFTVFSHIIPGTIALGMLTTNCIETANIIKMIAIMAFNGAFVAGGFINAIDLTPHFAKNIYAPMLTFTYISGIIMPIVVGSILQYYNQHVEAWSFLMGICGSVYLLGGTVYIIFGSASIQSWDVAYARQGFSVSGVYIDDEDVEFQT